MRVPLMFLVEMEMIERSEHAIAIEHTRLIRVEIDLNRLGEKRTIDDNRGKNQTGKRFYMDQMDPQRRFVTA